MTEDAKLDEACAPCRWRHRWSCWADITVSVEGRYEADCQERRCVRCNRVQRRVP